MIPEQQRFLVNEWIKRNIIKKRGGISFIKKRELFILDGILEETDIINKTSAHHSKIQNESFRSNHY